MLTDTILRLGRKNKVLIQIKLENKNEATKSRNKNAEERETKISND